VALSFDVAPVFAFTPDARIACLRILQDVEKAREVVGLAS
jgi:hypothetical protein